MGQKQRDQYGACYAAKRPWRIEHVTRQGHAVVRGADGDSMEYAFTIVPNRKGRKKG